MSGAQAAFVNQMISSVVKHVPDIDRATLILTGATEIRKNFSVEQQPFVIAGYMHGIKIVFIIAIAMTAVALVDACFTRWKKLDQGKVGGGMA